MLREDLRQIFAEKWEVKGRRGRVGVVFWE